jgi:hypothetical protein
VSSFIVRVMILCDTGCSASSVGAGTADFLIIDQELFGMNLHDIGRI